MRYLLVTLLAIIALFGCHKEDPEKKPYMTASIQGISFSAIGDQVQLMHDGSQPYILGSTGEATIKLELDEVSLGSHPLSLSRAIVQRGGFTSYSITGTLNITAVTPYVVGSFAFTCNDDTKVTSGAFLVYND